MRSAWKTDKMIAGDLQDKISKVAGVDMSNGFLVLLLLLLILHFINQEHGGREAETDPSENNVFIEIGGDIRNPGVYSFHRSADLGQLISLGGGLKSGGIDPVSVKNVSLGSGKKITVSIDDVEPRIAFQEMDAFKKLTLGIPVSVNEESEEGLTSLPGVGPGLAKAIILERRRKGGFKKVEELLSVYGIGERKYSRIAPYITE